VANQKSASHLSPEETASHLWKNMS
jgi:hypothetical protein